jgi:hypothetical protein
VRVRGVALVGSVEGREELLQAGWPSSGIDSRRATAPACCAEAAMWRPAK